MLQKYGFNDGSTVPDTADVFREVYITALNCIAEKLNSQVRVTAFDRRGMHNYCMIVIVNKEKVEALPIEQLATGEASIDQNDIVGMDEAMEKAVSYARKLGLDNYVVERAEVDADFLGIFMRGMQSCKNEQEVASFKL